MAWFRNLMIMISCMFSQMYCENQILGGFDCANLEAKAQPINLLEVSPCPVVQINASTRDESVQIINTLTTTSTSVTTCSIVKSITIIRCGMHSHQMILFGPSSPEMIQLTSQTCDAVAKTGQWEYSPQKFVSDIKINRTTHLSVTEIGDLDADGYCDGVGFTYRGTSYKRALVQAAYTIKITQYEASIDVSTNSIMLRDGLVCEHNQGFCHDALVGLSMWDPAQESCKEGYIYELYCGHATIVSGNIQDPEVIHINSSRVFFVSKLSKPTMICGIYNVYPTDYQRLYVHIVKNHDILPAKQITARQVQPTLYTNTKISYLQYQMNIEIKNIYNDIISQVCRVEQQMLENKINIARLTDGSLMHLIGFGDRGTFIQINGEVAHLITCPQVNVILRTVDECYNAIPISQNGSDKFIMPLSRVISKVASVRPCSEITPFIFQIGEKWVSMTPKFRYVNPPLTYTPKTKIDLKLTRIQGIAQGGIYSEKELDSFYNFLSHGSRRDAILSALSDNISFKSSTNFDITNAISKEGWKKIMRKNLEHLWGWLVGIGEILNGCLAVYVIIMLCKIIISTAIRAFTLYHVAGCSWRLLGSLTGALTTFCTLFFKNKQQASGEIAPNDQVRCRITNNEDETEIILPTGGCASAPADEEDLSAKFNFMVPPAPSRLYP